MEKQIKLAGVTFANEKEDGGRNRQQILSEMPGYISVKLILGTYHCTLTPIIYPNKEFYSKVKNACEMLGIKKPAYDYRAYKLAEKEIKKLEKR